MLAQPPDDLAHPMATTASSSSSSREREDPYSARAFPPIRHRSTPVGLLRHHKKTPSIGRAPIKETLNASLSYDDDDEGGIRVNQYILKQEIGRGSFGAVYFAVDELGNKYAVKEFSKSRLRKRSQSNILRRPGRRPGFLNAQGHRRSASEIFKEQEGGNPLFLIREEIAILKKIDHENVVNLIEVLDDPEGDSLYVVFEMCEKGVVMKVDLDHNAVPYPEEQCRLWFRDMILGIEYLHAQGIVHRDIKPDNLLLTADDVLKIVDFGVSEMFEKNSPMMTKKSAGSPAFLPPELCVAGHGDVSGPAADIWSMGVTLYCLLFGCLPFNHAGIMELYDSIKSDDIPLPDNVDPFLADLMRRILEKNPAKRITMLELREHPWVTCNGQDELLSVEENTTDIITPTKTELEKAITENVRGQVMAVLRAARKMKRLTGSRSSTTTAAATPTPVPFPGEAPPQRSQSLNLDDRGHYQQQLNVSGINVAISLDNLVHDPPARGAVGPPNNVVTTAPQCESPLPVGGGGDGGDGGGGGGGMF